MRKFYPDAAVRWFSGYTMIFLFVILPVVTGFALMKQMVPEDAWFGPTVGFGLSFFGCCLIHVGFWEKCFSHLELSPQQICWKCPLRKDRVISAENCVEIGAYMENEGNGIPKEQIYFSDHLNPKDNMGKNGVIKASKHLIKFWYSDELCDYLIRTYSGKQTSCLLAYCQQRKRW